MADQILQPPVGQSLDQISDEHGLGIVQIFLNAAVACIAHARELIPWVSTCFQTRYIDQLCIDAGNAKTLYADFCCSSVAGSKEVGTQEFRVLRRGLDRRADRILDLIDGGVAEALNCGFLEAFQVFITADTKDPAATLEVYTFRFTYNHKSVSQVTITKVADPFTIKTVHRGFTSSIRALLRTLKDLPRLPRHRSLGMSLLYNEKCPSDYQPSGFVDVKQYRQVPLRGSWTCLWQSLPTPTAEFIVGSRKVTVGSRDLQFMDRMTCSRLLDARIAAQMQTLQRTSSRDTELDPTQAILSHEKARDIVARPHQSVIEEYGPQRNPDARSESQPSTSEPSRSRPTTSGEVPKVSINSLANLSVGSKNRRRRNVVAGKIAELLVQARAMENNNHGLGNLFDGVQLQSGRIRRLERSFSVRCECGSTHEEATMLLCELCGTSQHKICYGYELLRQGCLPEDHFCYDCLLLPREDRISHSMPGIVHMRLALQFLAGQPISQVKIGQEFCQSVFFAREDAAEPFAKLIDRLIEEGYISQCTDGIAVILESKNLLEAQTSYLDPLAGITHHYQIVRDGDTFEKRRNEVLKSLKLYVGERQFSLRDLSNSCYDRIHVKNNTGCEVIRWGFYSSWKRKRVDSLNADTPRRKISISNTFVNVNRSTPSTSMTMSEAMQDATSEAGWSVCLDSRLQPGSTTFN